MTEVLNDEQLHLWYELWLNRGMPIEVLDYIATGAIGPFPPDQIVMIVEKTDAERTLMWEAWDQFNCQATFEKAISESALTEIEFAHRIEVEEQPHQTTSFEEMSQAFITLLWYPDQITSDEKEGDKYAGRI